jgi:hypothetical protein
MTGAIPHAMFATAANQASLEAVRALERSRIEATRTNDVGRLESLLHDQLIYVNSAGEIYV